MDKSKAITALLLVVPEDELIDFALMGLYGAAVRADRGSVVPTDPSITRLCTEILRAIEQGHADRHEDRLAMIAAVTPTVAA